MFEKEVAAKQFGYKAQELLMQDILDGMEDFVSKLGYRAQQCEFQIIHLEHTIRSDGNRSMDTIKKDNKHDAEIISFEKEKEERALRMSA